MIFFWNIWDAKEIIAFLRWGSAWQLIATSIATILGGLIAAFVGFLASKRIEKRREENARQLDATRLKNLLTVVSNEVNNNLKILKEEKEQMIFPSDEWYKELIPVDIRNVFLSQMSNINLPKTSEAISLLLQAYRIFDHANRTHKYYANRFKTADEKISDNTIEIWNRDWKALIGSDLELTEVVAHRINDFLDVISSK